jgi:hypothetical protein
VLIIAFLAIASEGVLCALPCSAALTNLTGDAGAPTGHCETHPVQPSADLTLAAAPGFCGEHASTSSPSERASTRIAFRDVSTLQTVSLSSEDRRGNIQGSNLRTGVHGSPPSLAPPLRI